MSRFGLRSSSDIFKLSEEQANRKKIGNDGKMSSKRSCQRKKKSISLENDVKLNESCSKMEEDKPSVSIMCSLPLNRLTGFIEKLNTNNWSFEIKNEYNQKSSHNDEKIVEIMNLCEKQTNIAAYDNVVSNHQEFDECTSPLEESVRILCLYCDKKFTSYKMQLKHVEKFHIQNKNRRCSGRNSQMATLSDSKKQRVEHCNIVLTKYPGCTYCKRSKTHQIEAPTKDLNGLFLHFVDCHSDKYFGCKACMQRFQNGVKLSQHMQNVHKDIPSLQDESSKNKEYDTVVFLEKEDSDKNCREKGKTAKPRSSKSQKHVTVMNIVGTIPDDPSPTNSNTIMGAEEPILSRLGLVQNRLPNNRKGVRSRKDSTLSESILKSDQPSVYMSAVKARNKSGKNAVRESGDAEVVFRMPTRTEMLSSVFEENFYRDVLSNVRNNILYFLDGKLLENADNAINMNSSVSVVKHQIPTIRNTLAESPVKLDDSNALDSEIHAATSLSTITAFPTLLTAEQYGGDTVLSKIRRPHTKHSWKWKWDSVKKFKLINEGGKIVKKMKQPMLGLRDLSKLDMWTQLSMRQKHEMQQYSLKDESHSNKSVREEKQRINEQLNYILDMRLLPHIILEQTEQAIIKIENDEFGTLSYIQNTEEDRADNILSQSFADDTFFAVLQLLPNHELQCHQKQLVLSGEWARPRCYLCMCCGAKFEKLKSLEEHKMFRHSHILSTHYEVVGRELLAGNSLRHLFIPNRALSYYGNESYNSIARKFSWRKNETLDDSCRRMITGSTGDDDSSDSIQSTVNSCTLNTYSAKHSTTTDECDTDTKTTLDINNGSPSNSIQSSNSLFTAPLKLHLKCKEAASVSTKCSKCTRRCSGTLDLYRHMLDCSGDYIWSLAKKRKYRYYCGSKKRRSWNKHNFAELRKKQQKIAKPSPPSNDTEESVSSSKVKTPSRQRPSDAESIKKMLENLPPKRICKKIFPALTKTKKSKFITKHKIFSSQGRLRSTRARQISMLSKAKGKFSNKSTKNKKMLHHKADKIAKHKSKKIIKLDSSCSNLNICSNNLETENVRNHKNPNDKLFPTGITIDSSITDYAKTDLSKCETSSMPSKEHKSVVECTSQLKNIASENENSTTESRTCISLRSNKSVQQTDLKNQTTLETVGNYELKNNSQYADTVACNKKRSKKINDCIAMLTGKLEEKLKTEQNMVNRDEPCIGTEINNDHKSKSGVEMKPPKRKTLSRKIIKMDNITAQTTLSKAQTGLESTTAELTITPKVSRAPTVANSAITKMTTVPISSNAITTSKPSAQTNMNTNYLQNVVNINLSEENNQCPALHLQPTHLKTANIAPVSSAIPPISLASSNLNKALLLPKQPATVLVNKKLSSLSNPNAIIELVPPFPTLPLALPMPNIPVNVSPLPPPPPPALSVLPQPSLLSTPVSITPVVPVAPIMPVAPMAPVLPVAPLFNSEPLNLSNTKSVKKQNSTELICLPSYRSGIPVRRQTICCFEARNFILEDEPLDLSKKSSKDQTGDVPAVITLTPIVTPIDTHHITPVGVNMTLAPHQDVILNKQFYSNLELLKIPQIRNPGNTPSTEVVFVNCTPKCSSKKRNGGKNSNENASKQASTNNGKGSNKEASSHRKENLVKGKTSQKMDDEVINHIDDAINSVVNAVKASLPDNNENDKVENNKLNKESDNMQVIHLIPPVHLQAEQTPQTQPMQSTSMQLVVSKPLLLDTSVNMQKSSEESTKKIEDNIKEMRPLVVLPQKRHVRSKTLDCHPSVLAAMPEILSDSFQYIPDEPVPENNVKAANTLTTSKNSECASIIENFPKSTTESPDINCKSKPCNRETPLPDFETVLHQKSNNDVSVSNEAQVIDKEPSSFPPELHNEVNKCVSPAVGGFNEINPNMTTEENMSNINNTSSGFHSCGQVENTVEAKKKQRRRRKNELAAIVADQLLESFKIDKTRRDNLKKLENLAYEKSEDLFVTGMLLMSSTKRNVVSSKSDHLNSDMNSNKIADGINRKKQDQSKPKTSKVRSKTNASCSKALKPADTRSTSANNRSTEKTREKDVTTKRNKKRNYRSKGKPLDNENISKLKSSLESFSIGIEKQLTELEARNSATINVSERKVLNNSPAAVRPSLIRPSILSANIESNINVHKSPLIESKSIVLSRDPRLNKNIHKNENNEFTEAIACEKDKNMEEIGDVEEDNYLTEIAKNVNEKIMSSENEEFMFMNDGFELANELQDDSNSKFYSRPPTSMSVRSAPNFNDDRSNFGSICDENTNTEVMDMDLEDELSVYTSYSQDAGRGRGRRRRRRRSILLKRRPKKRVNHTSSEKFECTLCKKIFYTLNSLTKHNMTIAHVSKLSAQEYLLSKTLENISTPRTYKEPQKCIAGEGTVLKKSVDSIEMHRISDIKEYECTEAHHNNQQRVGNVNSIDRREVNDVGKGKTPFNNSSRLNLNPDERLFFECCNILKGAETACVNNGDENNGAGAFEYNFKDKPQISVAHCSSFKRSEIPKKHVTPERASCKSSASQHEFRSPPMLPSTIVNRGGPIISARDLRASSPNYSGVSQFSAVTTTSRFKTKAAMKGYENTNVDLTLCKELETKSPAVCKLTELADIALGNEKSNSPEFVSLSNEQEGSLFRPLTSREYLTSSAAVDNPKICGDGNGDRIKSNEDHSSTSSKTIMHSSKIKSVIEENSKEACRKIVIPDRPFKNIGLEEKETITFQKPKTTINLLNDDNSISTTSYSDRDDFDFASMSCDEEPSPKVSNERNVKNNSDSSSSRATAKTFENKSLIMDRIFKNMGTKAKTPIKVQSIGIQKDPSPKADINQLFDELRGDCEAKVRSSESVSKKNTTLESSDNLPVKQRQPVSQTEGIFPLKRGIKETRKKSNVSAKSQKEINRLQSELGMSQEEIVKLISEGQRKSKRRCATNRPKKLVEMWSSDEYEEFLSTKDIIALIEEKEKQETRKKRKTSNQLSTCVNKNKGMETPKLIASRRKSVRCLTEKEEILLEAPTELQKSECCKSNGAAKIQNNHAPTHSLENKGKNTRSSTVAESDIKHKTSINSELNHKSTTNRINNKKKKLSKANSEAVVPKSLALNKDARTASKIETSFKRAKDKQPAKNQKSDKYLSELKQTNSRTRNSRERKLSDCKDIVNNVKTLNREPSTSVVVNKRHINSTNQSYKNRRKNQSNHSPARRKRMASEKLYYWSSSSDEDFGKINSSCVQEFDGGEQYQKHGWIVGDSHKKLVTLLAIAKGNKKVDNSCGVKKNVCRKKN